MANEFKIKNGYLSEGNSQITGSLIVSGGITGSLFGTSSYATTASYYGGSVISSSYAVTASYATNAANGGVTKILAGANVNLSPVSGLGDVTVTSFGTNLYNTATGSYGSFYDTGSVLATSATAVYSMSLSTTDVSNGVFVSASNGDLTRVKFTNAGVYNLQFSSQFSNTDNSNQDVVIWVRKNGSDITDSSGVATVPPFKAGSNGQVLAAWNYYLSLSANDYIQLCWHVEQANVITLETIAAGTSPTHPRTPSTILTATRVDTFLSNTGSFSGSFTGTLTGTASYATNALSASYAPSTPPFPYTGSATISGSLVVNDNATTSSLNTSARVLRDTSNRISLGWDNRGLVRSDGAISVDWENNTLKRSNITSLDWSDKITYDTSTSSSIKWETRELWDGDPLANGYNTASLDWNNRIAKDPSSNQSIDWANRTTYDRFTSQSIDWNTRVLYTPNDSNNALNWANDNFLGSNVYQRDYKSSLIQNTVSNTLNDPEASYLGDVIEVDGNSIYIDGTVTDGMLVYLDNATDTWYPVDQTTVTNQLLGIAHNVNAGTGWILLEGHVVVDDQHVGPLVQNANQGGAVYMKSGTGAGVMDTTKPLTGTNTSVMGHCYYNNAGTATQWMMKFRPMYA
jgi:hypothetical protein